MSMIHRLSRAACVALMILGAGVNLAVAEPQAKDDGYDEFIHKAGKLGPSHVTLGSEATLDLPAGYAFIPEKAARAIMKQMGNETDDTLIGLIFPEKKNTWFVTVEYIASGHINDEDARNWDAEKLLTQIRDNTAEANKRREQEGGVPLDIIGWVEKPHYDEATHRLVWSISARDRGAKENESIINYRTLMLGREGYISMIMATDLNAIAAQKPIANQLLSKVNFTDTKKYADFNASTDKVAAYGLAALVAGVAAKKLGLIAVLIAVIVKFAKVIALAVIGFFAVFKKKLKGKKASEDTNHPPQDRFPPQ